MNEKLLKEAHVVIANFFKSRREELGITQQQLADQTCLGVATVSRFERGQGIGLSQLLILCQHLNIYPFFAEKESYHPMAQTMRKAMGEVNDFKKSNPN